MEQESTETKVVRAMGTGLPPSAIDRLLMLPEGEAHDWVVLHWWRRNPESRRKRLPKPKVLGRSVRT